MNTRVWGRLFQRSSLSPLLLSVPCTPPLRQAWLTEHWQGTKPSANAERRCSPLAPGRCQQNRLSWACGPNSVFTCLPGSDTSSCGETIVGERASVNEWPIHSAGWMYTSIRTKKKRGKKEVLHKNAEQLETKVSRPPLRLEDYSTTAEPPVAIAATIRAETWRAIKGRKTSRMFGFRNKYRVWLGP